MRGCRQGGTPGVAGLPAGLDIPASVVQTMRFAANAWWSTSATPCRQCTAVVAEAGLAVVPHDPSQAALLLPWHAVAAVTTQLESSMQNNQGTHRGGGPAGAAVAVCIGTRPGSSCESLRRCTA